MSSEHRKWKTEYFFSGENFLKVWKFSAQNREVKKHFLWKSYKIVLLSTSLAVLRKQPQLFWPTFDKKLSGSRNTLPHLECTFKNTVENYSAEAQTFELKSKKRLNLWWKVPKCPLNTKNEKLSIFFGEVILRVWKISRPK